jgi:hypothetical protein
MGDKPKPKQPNRRGTRVVFYVTDADDYARLEREQETTGASVSEILRRALAAYWKKSPRR